MAQASPPSADQAKEDLDAPATREELVALSKKMNDRLQDPEIFPDPAARSLRDLPGS